MKKICTVALAGTLIFSGIHTSYSVHAEKPIKENKLFEDQKLKEIVYKEIEKARQEALLQNALFEEEKNIDKSQFEAISSNGTGITPSFVPSPGQGSSTSWSQIATGSKILTKGDFYLSGTLIGLTAFFIGLVNVPAATFATAWSISVSSVPSALVGEKLQFKKEFKWVDKAKYIYDVRTTQFINRNGKVVTISTKTVRENGWGND